MNKHILLIIRGMSWDKLRATITVIMSVWFEPALKTSSSFSIRQMLLVFCKLGDGD